MRNLTVFFSVISFLFIYEITCVQGEILRKLCLQAYSFGGSVGKKIYISETLKQKHFAHIMVESPDACPSSTDFQLQTYDC